MTIMELLLKSYILVGIISAILYLLHRFFKIDVSKVMLFFERVFMGIIFLMTVYILIVSIL